MDAYFQKIEGREYPAKLKYQFTNQKIITFTVPKEYLESHASSLQQFKDNNAPQMIYLSFLQFIIASLNNQRLGSNNNDTRFSVSNIHDQRAVLLDGQSPSVSLPKYCIIIEYLCKDNKGMPLYTTEMPTESTLNEIFANDNFAGIRYFFIIFDPKLDPMAAFDAQIERNKNYLMIEHIRTKYNKKLNDAVNIVYKANQQKNKSRLQNAINSESADDGSNNNNSGGGDGNDFTPENTDRIRNTTVRVGNDVINMREVIDNIQIKDKNQFYRSICDYKKLALPISLLLDNAKIYEKNELNSLDYNLKERCPIKNELQICNWNNISHANSRFFVDRDAEPDPDPNVISVTYNDVQANMSNYLRTQNGITTFEMPLKLVAWIYMPDSASVPNLMKEVFPFKSYSPFHSLYKSYMKDFEQDLAEKRAKEAADEITEWQRKSTQKVKYSKMGQTPEDFKKQVESILMKRKFSKTETKRNDAISFSSDVVNLMNNVTVLRNKYDRDLNDVYKEKLANKIDGETTTFIRLATSNREDYNRLLEIKDNFNKDLNKMYEAENNARYKKALKLYQEEKLAEYVREVNPLTPDMTNSVKSMLHWVKKERLLRTYDKEGNYTISLCIPYFTKDCSLGRSNWMHAQDFLFYDSMLAFGVCHETFHRTALSSFYCFADPEKSQEHLGTKLKPMIANVGGPASSKSHITDSLKSMAIPQTILSMDGFTEKALATGNTENTNDVVYTMDEMTSVMTTNSNKMSPADQNIHRQIKSIISNGSITRAVCDFDENDKRYTKVIESLINMTLIGNKNQTNTGDDKSLETRTIEYISKAIDRRDKTTSEILSTIYSSATKRASDILVGIKFKITQFLMFDLLKLLGTHVMPVPVNIKIGKILFASMMSGLKHKFPHLANEIRTPIKNFIMMYILTCHSAIDLNFFSEISPFMYRQPGDKETICEEFSHEQVLKTAPALCISEDTAILELTFYIKHSVYNEFLYNSLIEFVQKVCHYKFIKEPESQQLKEKVKQLQGTTKYTEEQTKKFTQTVKESYFFDDADIEDPRKIYTKNDYYSEKEILSIKFWRRSKSIEIEEGGKLRKKKIQLIDTNWLVVPNSQNKYDLAKKIYACIHNKLACNRETVVSVLDKEEKFLINFKALPVYGIKETEDGTTKTTKTLIRDENDCFKNFIGELYNPAKNYCDGIFKFVTNNQDETKSVCLINVHYLIECSLHKLLRAGLLTMQHAHTRPRTILISKNVVSTPHLFLRYDLKYVPRTIKCANPEFLDDHLQDLVYQNSRSTIKVDYKRSQNSQEHDYDLEEVIFREHAIDCGVEDEFLGMYLPKNVNESIRAQHKFDVKLRGIQKTNYPMNIVKKLPPIKKYNKKLDLTVDETCKLTEDSNDNVIATAPLFNNNTPPSKPNSANPPKKQKTINRSSTSNFHKGKKSALFE